MSHHANGLAAFKFFLPRMLALLSTLLWCLSARAADPPERLDILVRNVRVIDGTGRPEFRADVAIRQGRIVTVGKVEAAANETIE